MAPGSAFVVVAEPWPAARVPAPVHPPAREPPIERWPVTFRGDFGDIIDAAVFVAELVNRPRTPFSHRAACRDHPDVSWFPGRGEHAAPAKAICATCPALSDCLAYALADDTLTGVWGGTLPAERRRLKGAVPA